MANEYVNKVTLGNEDLIDLTGDTATAADVAEGKTFHLASGAQAVGTASGGSGVAITTTTVTIAAADWSNNTCTKSVTGVTATNNVLVTYAPASKVVYTAADIYCIAQGAGTLTFACTTTPTAAVTVNVMVIDGGVTVLNTYYVSGDVVSFEITGYEDRMGDVAVLTGDTVEVTVKGLPPARPGHAVSTFTLKVGSTQDASDIASFSGLSSNDDVRSFVMPACDVYLSYVRET